MNIWFLMARYKMKLDHTGLERQNKVAWRTGSSYRRKTACDLSVQQIR